jgi:stage IV sporulation protein B
MLTPVGCPIGIYVQTEGILVIDTGSFSSPSGKEAAPAKGVLKQGDYIRNIDGREPESKEELMEIIAESEGKTLLLTVNRDGEEICLPITPEQNAEGEYKLGIWVRDSAQGIGTLTFVDENGFFGALGHGINDLDTTELMELKTGGLYKTDIISITRSIPGSPGELTGVIAYAAKNKLGEIVNNTSRGIYGILEEEKIEITEEPLKLALKQEIEKGPAQILCTLTDEPAWYDIEITAIHEENDNINRGLEIKVTDEELLNIAGGIVQGMSGSPIVQNGKLAGAVTHVMVNDPTRGYGIFIEEMLGQ